MADERIRLDLDLTQFTNSAKEGTAALQTMAVVADQNVVTSLKKTEDAANQTALAKNRLGMAVMSASYAFQDFTSQLGTRGLSGAFAAIQNNIPAILVGLGAGTGVTAVLSAASVAAGLLYDNLGKANKALDESAKKLKEQADAQQAAVAALGGKPDAGTGPKVADQGQMIDRIFSGRQVGGIQRGAMSRILGGVGGSDMTRQELEQETDLTGQLGRFDAQTAEQFNLMPLQFRTPEGIERFQKGREAAKQALTDQLQQLQQGAATRRANRLISEAVKPGKAGQRARRELIAMARNAPNGVFPPNFVHDLEEIDKLDLSGGQELTEAGAENEAIWRRGMAQQAATEAADFTPGGTPPGAPKPFMNFGNLERDKQRIMQFGWTQQAIDTANAAGATRPVGLPGVSMAQRRQRANDAANVLGRQQMPNAIDAQGNPMFDQNAKLMDEMEILQNQVMKTQRYVSSSVQRLERIREKNRIIEQRNDQINNTQLNRGR